MGVATLVPDATVMPDAWVRERGLPPVHHESVRETVRGPVVAAVDVWDRGEQVVRRAIDLAGNTRNRLIIVGVTPSDARADLAAMRLHAASRLARRAGIPTEHQLLVSDDPGEAILTAARAAGAGTLVVDAMAWPSWSRGSSVVAHIVLRTPCPVLIEGMPGLNGRRRSS